MAKENDNYITFYDMEGEVEFHKTYDDAIKHCKKICHDSFDDGYDEEILDGGLIVAQVISKSKFIVTDEKKNYKFEYEDDIPEDSEYDSEDVWPYNNEYDSVGDIHLIYHNHYAQDIENIFKHIRAAISSLHSNDTESALNSLIAINDEVQIYPDTINITEA